MTTQFDTQCTTPLAERLISLYAEYVEGYIDSSKDKYNTLVKTATLKDILYMIYHTPFERHSVVLYNKVCDVIGEKNIPTEIVSKVASNKEWIAKMDAISV